VELGILDPQFPPPSNRRSKSMDKANMNDVVFSGTPPPRAPEPAPEIRRDSLGRKISPTALEALRATQFKPGVSNPGGNFKRQREHALAVVVKLMKSGKLKPSDTVAHFMNTLYDMDARSETPRQFLRALEKLNKQALRAIDASLL
jgi:hypothetical protein